MLGLLAEDLAHLDPAMLERAIDRHVSMSPFMPKAADLIALAQKLTAPRTSLDDYAEQLNGMDFSKDSGRHWFISRTADGTRYLDCTNG